MNHFIFSAYLVFIFSLPVGLYFLWQGKTSLSRRFFGFFWLTVAFWTFFVGKQFHLLRMMPDHVWGLLLHLGCIYVPLIYFHFALHLTKNREKLRLPLKIGYALFALFIFLIAFSNLFTAEIIYREPYAYPKPSILYPVYIAFFQVYGFWGAFLIFRWAQQFCNETRGVIYLFLILQIMAHIGAMDNYLIMYDINWFPLYPHGLYLIIPYLFSSLFLMKRLES